MAKKRLTVLSVGTLIEEFYGTEECKWKLGEVAEITSDGFVAKSGVSYSTGDIGTRWRSVDAPVGQPDVGMTVRELLASAEELPCNVLACHGDTIKAPLRPSLDVAIERYGNLTKQLEPFLTRMESWRMVRIHGDEVLADEGWQATHDALVDELRETWEELGSHLGNLVANGLVAKVTNRSRRDAWMRPGAKVALRPDALKRFGAFYSADVLENLTVRAAGASDVFLVSGDREIGPVHKAHVVKRAKVSPQ